MQISKISPLSSSNTKPLFTAKKTKAPAIPQNTTRIITPAQKNLYNINFQKSRLNRAHSQSIMRDFDAITKFQTQISPEAKDISKIAESTFDTIQKRIDKTKELGQKQKDGTIVLSGVNRVQKYNPKSSTYFEYEIKDELPQARLVSYCALNQEGIIFIKSYKYDTNTQTEKTFLRENEYGGFSYKEEEKNFNTPNRNNYGKTSRDFDFDCFGRLIQHTDTFSRCYFDKNTQKTREKILRTKKYTCDEFGKLSRYEGYDSYNMKDKYYLETYQNGILDKRIFEEDGVQYFYDEKSSLFRALN